jgi:excisionase family DNA binding protein
MAGQPLQHDSFDTRNAGGLPTTVAASEPLQPEPLRDLSEISSLLGVPKSWVYERTRRNAIPLVRVGRYVRFRWSEVARWIETGESQVELGALPEPIRGVR